MQEQYSALTGERIRRIDHPTGLTILVNEKPSYNKAYAVYATKFGSVNNVFVRDGRRRTLPDGIAHFLEHKLFENEEGDAFLRFGSAPISPRSRWRRSRGSSDRRSACMMTTRAGA